MIWQSGKGNLVPILGDLFFFVSALWLSLLVRQLSFPSADVFFAHLVPFSFIFLAWIATFFIFDLYHRTNLLFPKLLPPLIFKAQITNSAIAVLFFYFFPYVRLTPKTLLFLDLLFSFGLIWLWRCYFYSLVFRQKKLSVLFACWGGEAEELKRMVEKIPRLVISAGGRPDVIIFDKYRVGGELVDWRRFFFDGARFVAVQDFYENIFGRAPLSLINDQWILEHVSNQPKIVYAFFKRLLDVAIAGLAGILTLPLYLLIWPAVKLDDAGPVFYRQERVGRGGRVFSILKFRSMAEGRTVTRVGKFLRRTRLDELPQLWSVVKGDLSLIGPRPERPDYAAIYRQQIPYYDTRHFLAPGLSGWAQIYQVSHPHFFPSEEATREKFAYDIYYLKNRSFWLDIQIILKTIKILLYPVGR